MKQFKLVKTMATAGVNERMKRDRIFAAFVSKSLRRYQERDWGDTNEEDKVSNDYAVDNGERILAEYREDGVKPMRIWIITEWDRSATTILFPEEY